jgi:hypothetical protein
MKSQASTLYTKEAWIYSQPTTINVPITGNRRTLRLFKQKRKLLSFFSF